MQSALKYLAVSGTVVQLVCMLFDTAQVMLKKKYISSLVPDQLWFLLFHTSSNNLNSNTPV